MTPFSPKILAALQSPGVPSGGADGGVRPTGAEPGGVAPGTLPGSPGSPGVPSGSRALVKRPVRACT